MRVHAIKNMPTIVAAGLLCLVALIAMAMSGAARASTAPGMNVHMDFDRLVFNTSQRMCAADVVADVTIGSIGQSHWNSGSGLRPAGLDETSLLKAGYTIVTPVGFSRQQNLLDHRAHATKEFVTFGGSVANDRIQVGDMPTLRGAGRYLIVAVPMPDLSTGKLGESTLGVIDAFAVRNGNVVLASSTTEQGSVSSAGQQIALSQLEQELRNCP